MSPQMRAPGRGRGKATSGKGYRALGGQQYYKISVQGIDQWNTYFDTSLQPTAFFLVFWSSMLYWDTDETDPNSNEHICVCFPQVLIQYGKRPCPLRFTWLRWFWCDSLSGTMTQLDGILLVNGLLPSAAWCLVCADFLRIFSFIWEKELFVWRELKRRHWMSLQVRIIILHKLTDRLAHT